MRLGRGSGRPFTRGGFAVVVVLVLVLALGLVASACSGGGGDSAGGEGGTPPVAAVVPDRPPDVVGPGLNEAERAELDRLVDAFLDQPTATSARPVVELMERSGELRYAAWLLDLIQLAMSNLLNQAAVEALATLTGQETTRQTFRDATRLGGLVETWGVDGGDGYRRWKTTLFARFDPEFGPFLDSVDDEDRFTRLRLGGVRRGGIPELNQPARISAAEAEAWITPDEIVLGVDLGSDLDPVGGSGEAVAYPFRIVGHHELVNDEVAGIPVALVYCTLCRTGILFDRRVGDRVLEFETSGLLVNSNKVMVDRQTDTLWQHTEGTGFGGELAGTRLEFLPLETTTWAEWVADHPETEVIDIPDPIFFDEPERPPIAYPYEAEGPYATYYASAEPLFPVRSAPDALDGKAEVIGVERAGASLAISLEALVGGGTGEPPARFFPVGTAGVVVVPTSRGARVYDASASTLLGEGPAAGEVVEVAESGTSAATLADGSSLPRLVAEQGFWFSWWERHPETVIWPHP